MNDYEMERIHDSFYGKASPTDSVKEYAYNAGMDNPEKPWILTPNDVWMPNPHFVGDRGPHPED